jgi:hypothetical protein
VITFGHVRQLDRVLAETLRRAWAAGAGPGSERLVIDLDSFVCEVHGDHKQGAGFGYTHKLGYQELGRAGRDDQDAHARLLFRPEDFGAARNLTARSVGERAVARVAEHLSTGGEVDEHAPRPLIAALVRLVDLGAAAWEADGKARWTGALSVTDALSASAAETTREDEVDGSRLEMMRRYAEHSDCRCARSSEGVGSADG